MDNYATHKTPAIRKWLGARPRWHVHFTPTASSWVNLVERFFADITEKQIRRGVHRSTEELETAIRSYIEAVNDDPKPFRWTKSADNILAAIKRFCLKSFEIAAAQKEIARNSESGGGHWTLAHRRWLASQKFEHAAQQIVFQEGVDAIEDALQRVRRLEKQLALIVPEWSMAPVVEAYQAMRGASFLVAVTFAAEIGDVRRFDTPRQLMSFLGLVPAERSTGDTVRRKCLTLAGNRRARRALIEAAWRYPARVSETLRARLEGLPKPARDIAWKAQVRLCARYRRLSTTGKKLPVVVAALAREMAGGPLDARSRQRKGDALSRRCAEPGVEHERWGTPVASYVAGFAPDARPLDRGKPRDEDTEGGNQPADKSLINRRLSLHSQPCAAMPPFADGCLAPAGAQPRFLA